MEKKARLAGIEFAVDRTERGYQLRIETTPEHQTQREQVFALFDQFRAEARRAGVTSPELMAHWMRDQVRRWSPTRK
ncbi:hypothetical protein [Sulfobacillus harzensis]|uniref:Uncharacterized protein n=1 Tax=Sulfobacillus harzensis TaxID=2729629 RepID=A0A7Y0Q3K8_9FIRM|nr:hypothetical protein [Sulfobacillus harzensis]NMP23086.1 hypothetical protein [Sulfobacillus harzensis]